MTDSLSQLAALFENQYAFSIGYSPLYTSLFGSIAEWLLENRNGRVGSWLLEAARGQRPLDVSLLLAAGLHCDVLLEEPDVSSLAEYYPSAGGLRPSGQYIDSEWQIVPDFKQALFESIVARGDALHTFIQSNQVQTNETGRGLAWLFPVSLAGWPRVHLLDLGASAGLNLAGDWRHYQFRTAQDNGKILWLGRGTPTQFEIRSGGDNSVLRDQHVNNPEVLSRSGCDLKPIILNTAQDVAELTAFVWADQHERLERLREGISAYQMLKSSDAPVKLSAVELPVGLPEFLDSYSSQDNEPVLCYNTYIRMYLPDKGSALRRHLAGWAAKQDRPIVWVQWEPASCLNSIVGKAPHYGWLAWTIDLWHRGETEHWHIGWVHPHGQQVQWLPGLASWLKKARALYK